MLTALFAGFMLVISGPLLYRLIGRYIALVYALYALSLAIWFTTFLNDVLQFDYVNQSYPWVDSLGINLNFRLDGLSLLFALLIAVFGFLVFIYASGYLKKQPLYGRFFMYLLLFMMAMIGLVTADNIFLLFVFWEITSISSYLLIGFENHKEQARTSAWQALLVTGMGGLCLLAGLILISIASNSYTISGILNNGNGIIQHKLFYPALVLVLIGCFTKSAQFPFHFWLPNAMSAPTPVSAYLHSATMVKAGIYLLARFSPVFIGSDLWHFSLIVIGGATALIAAILALLQTDLKAMLAYTTIAALGMMVMMIGLGTVVALKAMLVFLLAHALYKGTMFMVVGAVDHSTGTRNYLNLRGLARHMPVTATGASLAALSMAGLMPFFGFIGKELMYEAALDSTFYVWLVFGLTFTTGVVFVAIAVVLSYSIFWYETKTPTPVKESPNFRLYTPVFLLGFGGLALGLMPTEFIQPILERAAQSITGSNEIKLKLVLWHGLTKELGFSVLTILLGITLYRFLPYTVRLNKKLQKVYTYGPENLYHFLFNGLLTGSKKLTATIQTGYLRSYIIYIVLFFSALLVTALWHAVPTLKMDDRFRAFLDTPIYELVIFGLVIASLIYILGTRSRLTSIIIMGLIGYSAALIYILFGAPDVAATQLLIETLTVVIFVLLLHKLPAFIYLSHQFKKFKFIAISVVFGSIMTYVMFMMQEYAVPSPLKEFYGTNSVALAHGRNIVNVIIVDFRALDTLGEITVLAVAALGIFALLRLRTDKKD